MLKYRYVDEGYDMKAGQSILVVEDEPKIREGLKDFLEFHEFRVTAVQDGLDAERVVSEHRFDLILLLNTSFQVYEQVKSRYTIDVAKRSFH